MDTCSCQQRMERCSVLTAKSLIMIIITAKSLMHIENVRSHEASNTH